MAKAPLKPPQLDIRVGDNRLPINPHFEFLVVRNPKTGRTSTIRTFRAKDVQIDHQDIPLTLQDAANPPGARSMLRFPLASVVQTVAPEGASVA